MGPLALLLIIANARERERERERERDREKRERCREGWEKGLGGYSEGLLTLLPRVRNNLMASVTVVVS